MEEQSPAFLYGKIVKDFNADGKMDILGSKFTSNSSEDRLLFILYSNGDGTFTKKDLSVYRPNIPTYEQVADFNGDNHPDIIEVNTGEDYQQSKPFYSIYLNDGSGNFSRTDYDRLLTRQYAVFFDFDGDNKDDLYENNDSSYYSSDNAFGEEVILVKQNTCQPFGQTKAADFNGFAETDIVYWNPNSGKWNSINGVWERGARVEQRTATWGSGALGDIPALGDYDGDGLTDYTVYRNSTGEWYILQSSDSTWSVVKFGVSGDVPIPADYDGGGKSDIAVFRPSDGNWYVLYSETRQFYATHFGTTGDKPVPADYDGDGKTDIAVFRPAEGNWYYLKSSDQNFVALHWGVETDIPIPADYDGDGKADVTVFRGGDWYFLRSLDDSFAIIHWGTEGDIPMPFYRNGEIAELVIYRPINSGWYNYRYSNYSFSFGEEGAIPVRLGLPNS